MQNVTLNFTDFSKLHHGRNSAKLSDLGLDIRKKPSTNFKVVMPDGEIVKLFPGGTRRKMVGPKKNKCVVSFFELVSWPRVGRQVQLRVLNR